MAPFNPTLKQTLNMLTDGPALTEEHIRAASVGHDHLPTYSYPTASAVAPFNPTLKQTLNMLTDQSHKSIEAITHSYQHRLHKNDCSELNAGQVGRGRPSVRSHSDQHRLHKIECSELAAGQVGRGRPRANPLVWAAGGSKLTLTTQGAHGSTLCGHPLRALTSHGEVH